MIFEEYLANNASKVDEYLDSVFAEQLASVKGEINVLDKELSSTSHIHDDIKSYLYTPLIDFYQNAGKRHRPLICLLACAAVGGDPKDAMASAVAIEHFHSAALIHDDIADLSKTRRGKPCVYLTEGEGLAINAGDMALSLVVSAVVRDDSLSDSTKIKVLDELVLMNALTIEGQALDIGWARDLRQDLSIDDCLAMAKRKTAYYSGAVPLAIGAIIGGGSEEEIEALRSFGLDTGLAFQIQDDLLNICGDESKLGKDFRSDIVEGKRTYAAVYALNESENAEELRSILDGDDNSDAALSRALDIMEECGAINEASDYAAKLVDRAKNSLNLVLPDSSSKELLISMADFFIERFG